MTTGFDAFVGYPPKVEVTERMLISAVPEDEREAFVSYLGTRAQKTRSGEIVFNKREYDAWKK